MSGARNLREVATVAGWNWRLFLYRRQRRFQRLRAEVVRRWRGQPKNAPTESELRLARRIAEGRAACEARARAYQEEMQENEDQDKNFTKMLSARGPAACEAARLEEQYHNRSLARRVPRGWKLTAEYRETQNRNGRYPTPSGRYTLRAPDGCEAILDLKGRRQYPPNWTVTAQPKGICSGFTITTPTGFIVSFDDWWNA